MPLQTLAVLLRREGTPVSGETEKEISAWTVDSLREHIVTLITEKDDRIAERDRRYEQRFESQEKAITTAMAAYATAVALAADRTASEISGIRDRYDLLLGERELRYGERFDASQVAITTALAEREKAIQAALLEREKAVQAAFAAQETAVQLALSGLRSFYDTVLTERDERYMERFEALDKHVRNAIGTMDREFVERLQQVRGEMMIGMATAEKAIEKAEIATEKRFHSVNEFRAQQADIIQTFARKTEVDTRFIGLTEKVDACLVQVGHGSLVAMPRTEYDRAHGDLVERVLQVERTMVDKLEAQTKAFDQRVQQLQAQLSSLEAITR